MKKTSWMMAAFALAVMTGCEQEPRFSIAGEISEADGQMLYFEENGLEGINCIDSVKLEAGGRFEFAHRVGDDAPEFYRLRIGNKTISLTVDSTEAVTVKAALPTMTTGYEVTGSEGCEKIKQLAVGQTRMLKQLQELSARVTAPGILRDSIDGQIAAYKRKVITDYILKAPASGYAYYALFQYIGGMPLFNPESNREDVRIVGAVATAWQQAYPHSYRALHLRNLALRGLKNTRKVQREQVPAELVEEVALLDLALPDMKGDLRRLTDLKGKVVLLDFTVYQTQESPARNMALRELYEAYAPQGLEIYQVAMDPDEHFWKTSADNLPWVCVRDAMGNSMRTYNVSNLPTYFLIDRDNALYMRSDAIKDVAQLKGEIELLLAR